MKAYTDIEQSKKLAEILPLESADMYWDYNVQKHEYYPMVMDDQFDDTCVRAWSLVALLGVLGHPRCFQGDKPTYWFCGCFGKDKLYHEVEADNPIDACYEMILKLHELKML